MSGYARCALATFVNPTAEIRLGHASGVSLSWFQEMKDVRRRQGSSSRASYLFAVGFGGSLQDSPFDVD